MKTLFDLVKEDLDVRNRIGFEQWHKELYPDDGRDWLKEAYEESLDKCIYLKGELLRRERQTITPSSYGAGPVWHNGKGKGDTQEI